MKSLSLLFLIFLTFVYSCSDSHATKATNLKVVNDSLTVSNEKIKVLNDSLYKIMEVKLADEKTSLVAVLWFPKAAYLQYRSAPIYKYLETAISNLKSASILNNTDSLYSKLDFYKGNILRIDSEIYNEIKVKAEIITHYLDSLKQSDNENLNFNFSKKPKDEQLLILNQTIQNIRIVEKDILMFCNDKIK